MLTQCGTFLFGTNDIIAQQLIEKKGLRRHDVDMIPPPSRYTVHSRRPAKILQRRDLRHYATRPLEDASLVI